MNIRDNSCKHTERAEYVTTNLYIKHIHSSDIVNSKCVNKHNSNSASRNKSTVKNKIVFYNIIITLKLVFL